MIIAETTALILLGAGRSQRFGAADKLSAMFLGEPLGMHAVAALESVPFARRIAVTSGTTLDYAARGCEVVRNPAPEAGLSSSVRLGVAAARRARIEAVLIALADMPPITVAQVHRLFAAAKGPDTVVASSDGIRPCPPALFGAAHFDALERLEGDAGARDLIRAGQHVVTSPDQLVDIDTEDDLAALRARF